MDDPQPFAVEVIGPPVAVDGDSIVGDGTQALPLRVSLVDCGTYGGAVRARRGVAPRQLQRTA